MGQWIAWEENSDGSREITHVLEDWELEEQIAKEASGIYQELGTLPPATVVSEDGLAGIMGKRCRESIKRAVDRGELPPPVKIMGQNCWTVGSIVKYVEERLQAQERRMARLRPSA